VLALVFIGSRALLHALPGDPISTILAETGTPIAADELRHELGLDQPFFTSLRSDAARFLHGDFGRSILSREAIAPLVGYRFMNTVKLTFLSLLIGLPLSLGLGLLTAGNPGGLADRFCTAYGAVVASLPTPWVGPLLIWLLAVRFPIFPIGGSALLPALLLGFVFVGFWSRLIRERVKETLREGAAPSARARGLPEWKVTLKYGFAPCSGPIAAYLGTQIGSFLQSAFIVEVIFGYNGMGTLIIDAVLSRDYPVVQAGIFFAAASALLGTWCGDVAQAWIDPRLEAEAK